MESPPLGLVGRLGWLGPTDSSRRSLSPAGLASCALRWVDLVRCCLTHFACGVPPQLRWPPPFSSLSTRRCYHRYDASTRTQSRPGEATSSEGDSRLWIGSGRRMLPAILCSSVDGCQLLSSQISDFSDLLWRQNPQSEMIPTASKIPQPRRMRYSLKDFQTELSRLHCYKKLYILLCKYWPCPCGDSHDKKLGGCMNIMLCLDTPWTRFWRF